MKYTHLEKICDIAINWDPSTSEDHGFSTPSAGLCIWKCRALPEIPAVPKEKDEEEDIYVIMGTPSWPRCETQPHLCAAGNYTQTPTHGDRHSITSPLGRVEGVGRTAGGQKGRVSISAYACSVAQSRLTLCHPLDCSLPGSCPWDFPGNTGLGCHFLIQGISLTQGSNLNLLCLLHHRQSLCLLSHWESLISAWKSP